ncbi:MAG: agmatinase [Thermoguttaceae bacterium]
MPLDPSKFFGLPSCDLEAAEVVILPLPLEATVTCGTGTWRAPRAILEASCQVELFDEETGVDFTERPRIHTLPALPPGGSLEDYLAATARLAAATRGKFLLALGGEHTVSYGVLAGLADDLGEVTIVHVDAHADLADELDGRRWSHGTVMRRLWERGCRLVQIGIRSLSRAEHELIGREERITTYYAHQLPQHWDRLLAALRGLSGKVYLSIDVDGLDPAVFPSTGTPQPGGLSWQQTMEIIRAVAAESSCQMLGADVVELVASPHPPGCDLSAARLAAKVLAWWEVGRRRT